MTLILSARQDMNLTNKHLTEEYGASACIKSRVNRQSVQSALISIQQRLKLYNQTPRNGLIVFCGEMATADGKVKKLIIDFEPFKPMHHSVYKCDGWFLALF